MNKVDHKCGVDLVSVFQDFENGPKYDFMLTCFLLYPNYVFVVLFPATLSVSLRLDAPRDPRVTEDQDRMQN